MTSNEKAPAMQLRDTLRQMVAVLQTERHSLAGMDLDGIMGAASDKVTLCDRLEVVTPDELDEECRGLLDAASRLNEVNRQLRNLIAANVSARLEALTGSPNAYGVRAGMSAPAYAYAGVRA